jgi:hypothetical protein
MMAKSRNKHPRNRNKKPAPSTAPATTKKTPATKTRQITADTFGPNPPAIGGRERYGHIVVFDDESWPEITFTKHKRGASESFMENYRIWRSECGKKNRPQILKTDRGGEWNSKEFNSWCARRGLRRKRTAPHSSSGTAEKMIDSVQTRSMAMRNWAGCAEDTGLWPESMKYAATVIRFLPSASVQLRGRSPWEKRHEGKKPRMHTLHPWGCLAYPHISKRQRRRYENRAKRAMFMGLAENEDDGYRFYNPTTKRFFHAKSAEFREHIPFLAWHTTVEAEARSLIEEEKKRSKKALNKEKVAINTELNHPVQNVLLGPRKRTQRHHFDPQAWKLAQEHDERKKKEAMVTSCSLSKVQLSREEAEKRSEQQLVDNLRDWMDKHDTRRKNTERLPSGHIPDGRDAFTEALTGEDRRQWIAAIIQEMMSIDYKEVMKTIKRSDVPRGRRPIKARWVFDIKKNSDGTVERYKARLVAKGFLQKAGQDYAETFSPTPSFTSVRLLASIALQHSWKVYHQDVKTAFLEGELEWWERVYLEAPPGYVLDNDEVLALHKCLYGLKQASRKWFLKISKLLADQGYKQASADKCVWFKRNAQGKLTSAIAVHVDDILISGEEPLVKEIKAALNKEFTMKDLGQLTWYLGVKFAWSEKEVYLSQESYIKDILARHRMTEANPRSTPAAHDKLTKPSEKISEEELKWLDDRGRTSTEYRQIVGELIYLSERTRPDITYAVGQLSRHIQDARRVHWIAVKNVLAYLQGTQKFGLRFQKLASHKIAGYSDSDWAGDLDDAKSTSGYVFIHGNGAISWASKKQPMVARSSGEAELIALDLAAREALWLRKLEDDFSFPAGPTKIYEDNNSAKSMSERNERTQRTKHIKVKFFAIRGDVQSGDLKIEPVASADNTSDAFTKGLGYTKFHQFRTAMGVVEVPTEGKR